MKKKKNYNYYALNFKMPHLFREDLELLEKIIKEELKPKEYKLETEEFEYQEFKEISEDTETTSEFHIQTHSPYISIDFSNHSARLYADSDDLKTIGALKKIEEIIFRRERKTLWRISNLSMWSIVLIYLPQLLSIMSPKIGSKLVFILLLTFIVMVILWFFIGFRSLNNFSLIEFAYSKNKPNFFTRNKDQIILIIFGTIIGALVTIIFQKIY